MKHVCYPTIQHTCHIFSQIFLTPEKKVISFLVEQRTFQHFLIHDLLSSLIILLIVVLDFLFIYFWKKKQTLL